MQQKQIFLESEADAWYERNKQNLARVDFATADLVTASIVEICCLPTYSKSDKKIRILEVGCGEGRRLSWFSENFKAEVFGVEPSAIAVKQACSRGVVAKLGTAEQLPFESGMFDILIFGFCLYLCDREDLLRIAQEADRVLKPDAWLIINDFYAPSPVQRKYHHRSRVFSYKMDYREMFEWHPAYTCFSHRVIGHGGNEYTDDSQEWVATSVLRKKEISFE